MYILTFTEEQLKSFLSVLDRELKAGGMNSLATVVELHNVLASAKEATKTEPQNETPQAT